MNRQVTQAVIIVFGAISLGVLVFRYVLPSSSSGGTARNSSPVIGDDAKLTATPGQSTRLTPGDKPGVVYGAPNGERPLAEKTDERALARLRQELASGTPAQRAAAADELGHLRDKGAMPLLLTAIEHDDTRLRGRSGVAIQKILGGDFYFRASDPPAKRQKSIENMKKFWAMLQPVLP